KLAIERMEDVVGRLGPVVLGLSPVEMAVVYEGAIENHAAVPGQRPGNDIGRICGCSTIRGRTEPALRIGLCNEPGKVRNMLINLLDFLVPPGSNAGIEWIESVQATNHFWAAQIDSYGQAQTPGSKGIGNADQLRKKAIFENPRIGIDIVDGAPIYPHG